MSEREFLDWIDSTTRAEWVEGEVTVMAPANFEHSDLNLWLATILRVFVEQHDLGVAGWDTFVKLEADREQLRIPDVYFVAKARRRIIKKTLIDGPPDLVIEVVSPDSQSRDRREKFISYAAAGVREYWIVDPISERVEAYSLAKDGEYASIKPKRGRLYSTVIPNLYLKPVWLFAKKRPGVLEVIRQLGL